MGILISPLLGFLLSFFARYVGKQSMSVLLIGSVATSFIFALNMFNTVCIKGITCIYNFDWLIINNLELKFTFLFDPLTMIMTLLITFITTLVMTYSYSYLNEDPSLIRFLAYMSFFCLTMLTMVTSGNYIQFFVGWEGVGLASYLLISFWMTRNEANQGGLKAVIVNRVGDVFFMFALGLMWTLFKSFDFGVIFNIFPMIVDEHSYIALINKNISLASLLACCLLIAACAKSAQIFLHTWLPDAMEGPTPVSALLHSATMVTAGVFLIIRSSFIFSFTPNLSYFMAVLGILTALVAGLIGLNQYDLKKIIAYSTCSQLGYMFFTVGLGYYNFALFHLVTHAFFKCLLFLCSGAIIHAIGDEQDIRKMGQLYSFMPITFSAMTIGTLALTGFPMLAGFYSKDLILEVAFSSSSFGFVIFCIATIAAFWTAFYSMRSLYYVFFTPMSSLVKSNISKIEDAPLLMAIPIIILTLLSIVSGYFLEDLFVGPKSLLFFRNSIASPLMSSLTEFEYSGAFLKIIPTLAGLFGLISGLWVFYTSADYKAFLRFYLLFNLTNQKFYFDLIYNLTFAKFVVFFGYLQYKLVDRGLLELLGPHGLSRLVTYLAKKVSPLHNGYLLHYLLLNFSFIIMLLVIFY